ncbi:MAG: hypothetical protein JXR48_17930 [Candidatus Delongbacteria bacterium]|nr:hypothetical protein [Candidatus Delongbacteria bacterium]MBN2836839.1 hypothetical protein [Candidatus Delongbacteria bacterium]
MAKSKTKSLKFDIIVYSSILLFSLILCLVLIGFNNLAKERENAIYFSRIKEIKMLKEELKSQRDKYNRTISYVDLERYAKEELNLCSNIRIVKGFEIKDEKGIFPPQNLMINISLMNEELTF